MLEILQGLSAFSARHPELRLGLMARLVLAVVLGGAIGWERTYSRKPAGLRTNILICVGAAVLGDLSFRVGQIGGGLIADAERIAAQVVSGVGFLGAGTILQARGSVTGLTTAATLWVVAAIGLLVGFGENVAAVGATLIVLIALVPLRALEARAPKRERAIEGRDPDPDPAHAHSLGERDEA